ncbi:MFS transporter [Rhodotorula paludigena]|uniref:MFS transporter n=1 Tax=Rhodotorula paludigena TaxID=86838 RepID=UPI00316D676C
MSPTPRPLPSPTSTVHTLVDPVPAVPSHLHQSSTMPDDALHKAPSRVSQLDVVDPEARAREEAPQDAIWVDWDGPDDSANPLNWSRRRKWIISSVGIIFCCFVSLSVSGYSISVTSVQEELDVSKEVAVLGITLFTVTFGAAPLILAPLSEVYGRSLIYFLSALVFAIFFIPQALAKNIETVLVTRFISGCAGSTAVSLVGGTLADVWRGKDRGTPMAWFSFAAFGATGLGPVAFGYLTQIKGFRYVNWVMFAISMAFAAVLPLILDETRASVLLSRKAAKLRKETGDDRYISKDDFERGSIREMFKTSLGRPVQMLIREPVLISMTAWIAFTWGVLYLFLVSIPYVYSRVYGFSTGECGLVYITQFIGSAIGMAYDQYCMKFYHRNVAKRGPEARMYSAFGGGLCVPVGAFIFCFTAYPQCHWIGSCIGVVILYIGMYLVYLTAFSYLAEAYALYASSALSAMSFVRNVVGAVFPLFTTQMYDALGIQGAAGLTAGLGTVLSATPFILFIYGARLRARSPFAQELARREEADRIEREQWRARAQGKESAATSPERSEAEKERAPEQTV